MVLISKRMTRQSALPIALVCVASAACDPSATESRESVESGVDASTPDGAVSMDGAVVVDGAVDARANTPDANMIELPLLDHKQWRTYDATLDPLRGHQPAVLDCVQPGWFIERNMLEISTGQCNYVLLEHPSLQAAPANSEVLIELYHYDLVAAEPAQAHIALMFGDDLQWETMLPIPAEANVHQLRFRTTRALAVGEAIRFHLHNHGQNTWLLASVHVLLKP